MDNNAYAQKLQSTIDINDKLKDFFESEGYVKYVGLLEKKIVGYKRERDRVPEVGDFKYAFEEVSQDNKVVSRIKRAFTVTEEEVSSRKADLDSRINELQGIVGIPELLKKSSERAKAELVKLFEKSPSSAKTM